MARKKKISASVQRVVDRVSGGEKLCRFLRQKETGETEVCFFFEPSGRRCGPKTAEKAISAGLLVAGGDGLFGPETSQTWIAA